MMARKVYPPLEADDPRHGTLNGYSNYCCRCAACRAAGRIENQRQRADRYARDLPDDDPRHGTDNGYNNWGCRCPSCTEAHNVVSREWERRHRLTPAERLRHNAATRERRARKALIPLPDDDPRHGKSAGYVENRCRCTECRAWATTTRAAERARARLRTAA